MFVKMPQRVSDKEQTPTVVLRRSPRLLEIKLIDQEDPKTPKPKEQRRTCIPSSISAEKKKVCSRKTIKAQEVSETLKEPNSTTKGSENLRTGSRRSARLNHCGDECNAEKDMSRSFNRRNRKSERLVTLERRLTRSCTGHGSSTGNMNNGCSSGESKTKEVMGISTQFKGNLLKNQVNLNKKNRNDNRDGSDDTINEAVLSIIQKPVMGEEFFEKHTDYLRKKTNNKLGVSTAIIVHGGINGVAKQVGVKRKRDVVGVSQGWTKDQELALEKAYLIAKPTPHFWKKVSRLVPGKSAQECFDKIHCSHVTSLQPRPRSRARILNSQDTPLSASKLLEFSGRKAKRPGNSRQKIHVVQRTVRHMLQKQYNMEKDSEADLFSILEPTLSPRTQPKNRDLIHSTPEIHNQNKGEVLKRSSVALKKSVSIFNSSYETPIISPPVLKQVKNKALHEKYIDQLNCREANRKAASQKANKLQVLKQESSVQRKNAIKAAKNALVFDARDAIKNFQHQQAKAFSSSSDDDNCTGNDEEEGEDLFY